MRLVLSTVVVLVALTLPSGVQASSVANVFSQNNMSLSAPDFLSSVVGTSASFSNDSKSSKKSDKSKKSKKSKKSGKSKKSWKSPRPKDPHAVPELNASVAPLALLSIGGILAAGYERRRKLLLKKHP